MAENVALRKPVMLNGNQNPDQDSVDGCFESTHGKIAHDKIMFSNIYGFNFELVILVKACDSQLNCSSTG